MKRLHNISILILLFVCMLFVCPAALAAPLSATAEVERRDAFVGEAFVFQIQVSGSENPEKPELSHMKDFTVTFRGGQQNSSRSVTIINGRMTQNVQEGYVFAYHLTPKRAGRLVIPSVTIHAGGRTAHTEPVIINAKKPVETDDFKPSVSPPFMGLFQ